MSEPARTQGRFEGAVATQHGRVYAPQYNDLLTGGQWTSLPLMAGNGQIQQLKDFGASAPQRFYRVLKW